MKTNRYILILSMFFYNGVKCQVDSLKFIIKEPILDSISILKINELVLEIENLGKVKLISDTAFKSQFGIIGNKRRFKNWYLNFEDIEFNPNNRYDNITRFCLLFEDRQQKSKLFYVEGYVDENLHVSKKDFCLLQKGISTQSMLEGTYSDTLTKRIDKKLEMDQLLVDGTDLFKIKIPGLSKRNRYVSSIELKPKEGMINVEFYKNSTNSVVAENEYIDPKFCNCNNYEVVVLFYDFQSNNKSHRYYSECCYPVEYFVLTYSDLNLIEKGAFSFKNPNENFKFRRR